MAKSWIVDLWVKDASVTLPNGDNAKLSPSRAELRAIKSLPEHFRTPKWMTGKRWRVDWYEESHTGRSLRARSFTTKQEAESFSAELEDDIRMGRYLDPSERERTFAEVASDWIASKQKVKEATVIRYQEQLDYHILPQWGAVPIGAITHANINKWVAAMVAGTAPTNFARKKSQTKLSPASIRHVVRVGFGSVIRYAIRSRIISANPLEGVELPADNITEIPEMQVLNHQYIDELAAQAKDETKRASDETLMRLLAYSGPRINEALALQVGDVALGSKRIKVRRTWTRSAGNTWKLGPPKTWQKREIPIPDFLVEDIRSLMEDQKDSAWLFRGMSGKPLEYSTWYAQVWSRAASAVGLPKGFSPHDLRHTAASLAIAAGADVVVVQHMLGHKDATETLNTYSHLWPDRLDEVLTAMSKHRERALSAPPQETQDEAA